MERNVLPFVIKNAIILTVICVPALLFLYVVGQFTDLHPDAYRDLVRSILFGYGIYLIAMAFYNGLYKKVRATNGKRKESAEAKTISFAKTKNIISGKAKKENPLEAICLTFMVITFVNSVMMLTGLDTPKEGTFAYIHMMTRLFIVSGIIGIWMWKDVINGVKYFKFNNAFKNFHQKAHQHSMASISKMFTLITVVYCTVMIAFHRVINPAGGSFFYQSLLGILVLVTIAMFTLRIIKRSR